LQASHAALHPVLQHTPSTQVLWSQSWVVWHFFPRAHRAHVALLPPQSTSDSVPSCLPSLQSTVPPQPSGMVPQPSPAAVQSGWVLGTQASEPASISVVVVVEVVVVSVVEVVVVSVVEVVLVVALVVEPVVAPPVPLAPPFPPPLEELHAARSAPASIPTTIVPS
jgi:hypothetical protein